MRKLRFLYYLYLVLLPALALPSRAAVAAETASGWWYLFLFVGVIVYLDVVVELIPFPKTWSEALITVLIIPFQIALAMGGKEEVWVMFTYQFLVEAAGALVALAIYSTGRAEFELKKLMAMMLLLILPAMAVWIIFGPVVTDTILSWRSVFLATALVSAVVTNIKRLKGGRNEDDLWPLIIVGVFAFIIGGPFLLAMVE